MMLDDRLVSTTLTRRSDACGLVPQAWSLSPATGGAAVTFLRPVTIVSLKPVQAGWCSSHRYSALAAWSPLARQNGSLPRRL